MVNPAKSEARVERGLGLHGARKDGHRVLCRVCTMAHSEVLIQDPCPVVYQRQETLTVVHARLGFMMMMMVVVVVVVMIAVIIATTILLFW